MKPSELTPEALMKFFSEMDASGEEDGECEIHYGCSCVVQKGRKAAQMLLSIQETLGVKPGEGAPAEDAEAAMTARIMEVEAALMQPDDPAAPDGNAEALQEAEGEIDRLLVQNVELKEQNTKLREKVRDLYKQVERLYTRSEMSKLLGTLDDKIEEEAQKEATEGEEADQENPEGEPDSASASGEPSEPEPAEAEASEEASDAEDGATDAPADTNTSSIEEAPEESKGENSSDDDPADEETPDSESTAEAGRDPS